VAHLFERGTSFAAGIDNHVAAAIAAITHSPLVGTTGTTPEALITELLAGLAELPGGGFFDGGFGVEFEGGLTVLSDEHAVRVERTLSPGVTRIDVGGGDAYDVDYQE